MARSTQTGAAAGTGDNNDGREANVRAADPRAANAGQVNAAAAQGNAAAPLSLSDNLYVKMFKRIGFRAEAAKELIQTEQINPRDKLDVAW